MLAASPGCAGTWLAKSLVVAPGELIDGKYVVDRTLGHGGMGVVVAARNVHSGEPVAVKLMAPEARPEVAQRLVREARTCSRLRGPHVAHVIDAGTHDGRPYLVMELLSGRDLATVLDETTVAPHLACGYVMQACEGLGEAHMHGLVHRDVKPANLFLTTSGAIKVLDFGIAGAMDGGSVDGEQLTGVHEVMGSPGYMSPEQLRGKPLDARADVWALGVTLYELISGRHAFNGDTLAGLMHAIAYEPPAPLHEASPELQAVVDRCLAKNPAQRFGSTRELAWALAPFAADPARGLPRYLAPLGDLVAVRGIRVGALVRPNVADNLPPLPTGELARGSRMMERPSRFLFRRPRTLAAIAAVALVALVGFVSSGAEVTSAQILPRTPAAAPIVTPIEPTPPAAVAAHTASPDFVFAPMQMRQLPPAKKLKKPRR